MTLQDLSELGDRQLAYLASELLAQNERQLQLLVESERAGVPPLTVASVAFHAAHDAGEQDERRRLLNLYLKIHVAQTLEASSSQPLVELIDRAIANAGPSEKRDLAIVTLRALSVEDKWYLGTRLDDPALKWLTEGWIELCSRQGSARAKTAGPAGELALRECTDAIKDACRPYQNWERAIGDGDANQVGIALHEASRSFEKCLRWLTRDEQDRMRRQLRLFNDLATRFQGRRGTSAILETADEARALIDESEEVLDLLLGVSECHVTEIAGALSAHLSRRLRTELARWGELVPKLVLHPERATYSFIDDIGDALPPKSFHSL